MHLICYVYSFFLSLQLNSSHFQDKSVVRIIHSNNFFQKHFFFIFDLELFFLNLQNSFSSKIICFWNTLSGRNIQWEHTRRRTYRMIEFRDALKLKTLASSVIKHSLTMNSMEIIHCQCAFRTNSVFLKTKCCS